MKPTIIYVSGAPGSGKTTLAKLLSDRLYIPHVSSDLIHGGLEFTQTDHDRGVAISKVYLPLMINMAQSKISFVVDHVLQKDIAKASVIDKLKEHANIIYIHTQSTHPIERYIEKIKTSDSLGIQQRRDLLIKRAEHHRTNLVNTSESINLDVPTLTVNTNDGYNPSLDAIIAFIVKHKGTRFEQ